MLKRENSMMLFGLSASESSLKGIGLFLFVYLLEGYHKYHRAWYNILILSFYSPNNFNTASMTEPSPIIM